MKILTAPFYSLFSIDFYRRVIQAPLSQGFLYLTYLSGLGSAIVFFAFVFQALPAIDRFASWLGDEIPQITWTPEGIVMNARSPYAIVHPDLGPLIMIDTAKQEADPRDIGDFWLYVTATRVYVRTEEERVRIYDLTQPPEGLPAERFVIQINRRLVEDTYRELKPWIIFVVFILIFPFFFLWKLAEAFLFSLIGSLINLGRAPELPYSAVLNVSFFAITAATLIQLRGAFVPFLGQIPFGPAGTVLVTTIYLFLAIRKTRQSPEISPAV